MPGFTLVRVLLFGWGLLLLAFGGCDLIAPRARLVLATPSPGTRLEASPPAVTLEFSEGLANNSRVMVRPSFTLSASGERVYDSGPEFVAEGPDPADGTRRTLRVDLAPGLPNGLYWVQWRSAARQGNAVRNGSYCFSVGMPIPEDILRDTPGGRSERDMRQRQRSAAIAGGGILILLAFLIKRR